MNLPDPLLARRLLAMAQRDQETRERLAADGSLFDGYNSEMQAVHETNAAELAAILDTGGWPGPRRRRRRPAEAAWLVAQHAIGLPDFQRRCLTAIEAAADVPAWQPATLDDRIRVLEGREQRYGTAFDWDDHGEMSPQPIEDPDGVDAGRAAVGLSSLAEATVRHRAAAADGPRPLDLVGRRRAYQAWLRKVGWR